MSKRVDSSYSFYVIYFLSTNHLAVRNLLNIDITCLLFVTFIDAEMHLELGRFDGLIERKEKEEKRKKGTLRKGRGKIQ